MMRSLSGAVTLALLLAAAFVRANPVTSQGGAPVAAAESAHDGGSHDDGSGIASLQPLGPGGVTGPWDNLPSPDAGPVKSICDFYLGQRDHDTKFVGKTTIYLSAAWVGGTNINWFDQAKGGGPTTGVGAYRDWGNSTVRRVTSDNGCVLDTNDEGNQFRLQGAWSAGLWSTYKRLEIGPAYVRRLSPDISVGAGVNLAAHGTGTSDWGLALSPEVRVTYGDWVGARVGGTFTTAGQGEFGVVAPQFIMELFIAKRLKEEHFP